MSFHSHRKGHRKVHQRGYQKVSRLVTAFSLVFFTSISLSAGILSGQESSSAPPAKSSDLTQGLLDLLKEPTPDKPKLQANQKTFDNKGNMSASDPLAEVQLGMSTAADWLRSKEPLSKTEGLQNDIVARLDRLIEELEQQSPSTSKNSAQDKTPKGQNSSTSQRKNQLSSTNQQTASSNQQKGNAGGNAKQPSGQVSKPGDANEGDQPTKSSTDQDGPASPGPLQKRGPVAVDLRDPEALQRSAWGSLPDRVREQMQSRMVERFLPAYREQIEAYYRALSK